MEDTQFTELNPFANKMDVKLDMLRALVMYWIGRHVDSRNVIAVHHSSLRDAAVELTKELPEPDAFRGGIGHGSIFCFCAGP
jgi:hypothetical protein